MALLLPETFLGGHKELAQGYSFWDTCMDESYKQTVCVRLHGLSV